MTLFTTPRKTNFSPSTDPHHSKKASLETLTSNLGNFLKKWINSHDSLGERVFYGEAFSLAFLASNRQLDANTRRALVCLLNAKDYDAPEFHWEFNQYALRRYKQVSGDDSFDDFLASAPFKGTPCTNWSLLRLNTRLLRGDSRPPILQEVKQLLSRAQASNGLIMDEPHVRSFQYHCFSLAMLAEIYEQVGEADLFKRFIDGVAFIRNFILKDGNSLYIGRGQEQSFGYSCLVYILSTAYLWTGQPQYLADMYRVVSYITVFQKTNGSLPLVLNGCENINLRRIVDLTSTSYAGWYSYNNYFDYLPFAGYFLSQSLQRLTETDKKKAPTPSHSPIYADNDYIRITKQHYEVVIARPGGAWANDLAFPYIRYKGSSITPCYGGEQDTFSLYQKQDLPLPSLYNQKFMLRNRSIKLLNAQRLVVLSPLGLMIRRFSFLEKEIHIRTSIISPLRLTHNVLFFAEVEAITAQRLQGPTYRIISKQPLQYDRSALCALGPLKVFTSTSRSVELTIHLE